MRQIVDTQTTKSCTKMCLNVIALCELFVFGFAVLISVFHSYLFIEKAEIHIFEKCMHYVK